MKKILATLAIVLGFVTATSATLGAAAGRSFQVEVHPSFGPVQASPSFSAYALGAVEVLKGGGAFPNTTRTGPTETKALTYVSAEDFMSSSIPFYRGVFSPVAPWNNERGGTVWWWVRVTATDGGTVSLADIAVKLSSFSDNSLGRDTTFASSSYTPTAIAVTAGGQVINTGPSSQEGKMVIVGVGSKSFPVGNNGDVQVVRNYLSQFGNSWNTTCSVTVGVTTVTKVLGTVAPSVSARPRLSITRSPSATSLAVENNGNSGTFILQSTATIGGVWVDGGSVTAGQNMVLTSSTGNKFYRLKP